jgi:hypothetical protein
VPISEDQKWHWGEGNKYVIEGGKTILIVNGAAVVSTLTFLGNDKLHPPSLIWAMVLFSLGAMCSALIFCSSYFTQLNYGNSKWNSAKKWHIGTYMIVIISIVLFFVGIVFAAAGFFSLR